MKGIGIIAVMAMLNAGLSKAGDYTATNNMPEQIHNLMDSEGYAFDQKHFSIPKQNTNSLRNLQFIERQRFIPFLLPAKKPAGACGITRTSNMSAETPTK